MEESPTCKRYENHLKFITHVYSTIDDSKGSINGIHGSIGQIFLVHQPDEYAICMMVDMGFPRSREEEALRHVEKNSVELDMEWLFSHTEEPSQEYYKNCIITFPIIR